MPCPDSTGLQLGTRLLGWPHMCRGAHHRNGHKCGKELCIRKLTADTAPFITLLPPLFLISCVGSWFHLLFYARVNIKNFTPHNIHHFLRPLHSACYAMHCLFGLHVTVLDRKEIRNNVKPTISAHSSHPFTNCTRSTESCTTLSDLVVFTVSIATPDRTNITNITLLRGSKVFQRGSLSAEEQKMLQWTPFVKCDLV